MSRLVRVRFLWVVFAFLAGCVGVPSQELTTYREAFLEAKNAGDVLYDELSVVIVRMTGGSSATCQSANNQPPKCFEPNAVLLGTAGSDDPAIQARRAALRILAAYNLAIADLVEGKSATDLSLRIDELAGLATDLTTLAGVSSGGLSAFVTGPALAGLKQFAKRLERARSMQVARQSLLAEAPTINELIDLLIADTKPMYDVYFIGQGSFAAKQATSEARSREGARLTKFHESLTAYVQLLKQTKQSLANLQKAAAGSSNNLANVRAVIVEAIELRTVAETFWSAVRELRK